jgi:threonine dehydrogenase-like Zn-dependent dehydrogenase
LLAAEFARAGGAEVHLMDRSPESLAFARTLGFTETWVRDEVPAMPWDAVIDASTAPDLPALALELVEPGKRVVYIGIAGTASNIDTRTLALKDVTAVGILAASQGLAETIHYYAAGKVDPRALIAATVELGHAGDVLAGWRPAAAAGGPKIHIDPRL